MNEKYMSYAIKVELVFGLYFYSYISTLVNWPSRDTIDCFKTTMDQ